MMTPKKSLSAFEQFLAGRQILEDPASDFRSICRRLRVSPSDMDRFLLRETGFDGDDILFCYWNSFL